MLNLLVVFTLMVWVLGIAASELWPHLAASMVYSHNAWYGKHSLVNGVAWSLEVEWQFYVIAPLIFALTIRPRAHWFMLWIIVLMGGLVYGLSPMFGAEVVLSLLNYFGFFVGGVLAAAAVESCSLSIRPIVSDLICIAAGLAILLILMNGGQFGSVPVIGRRWSFVLLPMLTTLTLLGAMTGRITKAVLGWWPIYIVGGMCYSIYLYHFFVISAMSHLTKLAPGWFGSSPFGLTVYASVVVPGVVVVCALPYFLIERPFMIWRPGRTLLREAFRWPC